MQHINRIVVGVDGSANADAALKWALEESTLHDASVVAVLAWSYLSQPHLEGEPEFDPAFGEEQARKALHRALADINPAPPVEERVVNDLPAHALVAEGAEGDLLVTGTRGLGGFRGLLLGSVSERVLERAPCPVAVVRQDNKSPADRPVVVGVDGSETAGKALRWAAGEAATRKAPLHVVHAWHLPHLAAPDAEDLIDIVEEAAREVLDQALADPALSGLEVHGHMPHQGPAEALLQLAEDASLVVVGSRGMGPLGRVLLGSTSRQMAHHVPCPIVVVPPTRHA